MSGKRVILFIGLGVLLSSSIMFSLYLMTRQLDYRPPDESPPPPSPHAIVREVPASEWPLWTIRENA